MNITYHIKTNMSDYTAVIRAHKEVPTFDNINEATWSYAAGLFDSDGHVKKILSISQALKGIDCLHYMHDVFGGEVILHVEETDKHQASFNWVICDEPAIRFSLQLEKYVILKKREIVIMNEYFRTSGNYTKMYKEIVRIRKLPHDEIIDTVMPHDAYFAGFADGEACFDGNGKNYQHHSVTQRWRPILDLFCRRWGGCVNISKKAKKRNQSFYWDIYTFADKFLAALAPFIVGKRKQVELIMNMQPGEGQLVHAQLRELKGKCTAPTHLIDKINNGEGEVYKLPPKKLPKGVHKAPQDNMYTALLKHEGTQYSLGSFPSIEQAQAQYDTYKLAVYKWKHGTGPPVDLEFNTRATQKANAPKPPPPETQLPTGVYLTQGNIYQARYTTNAYGKKVHQLGTFKTIEEAVNARKEFETRLLLDGLKLTKQKRVFPDTRPVKLNA